MDINKVVDDMTESEAYEMFYAMSKRFDLRSVVIGRGDVEVVWAMVAGIGEERHELTDTEWATLQEQYEWRKMNDWLNNEAMDGLESAVRHAMRQIEQESIQYTVWCDGSKYTDHLMPLGLAKTVAKSLDMMGHADVQVVNVKDNIVIAKHEYVL